MSPILRTKALAATASLAILGQSDYTSGRVLLEKGLQTSAEDKKTTADMLHLLAFVAYNQGDEARARGLYENSLAIRREIADTWGIAVTLNNLGQIHYHHEDYAAARSLFEESVRIWRGLGDEHSVAVALTNLGLVESRERNYSRACSLMAEGLAIRRNLGNRYGLIYSLEAFAELAAAQGQAERTARLLGAAMALREDIGAPLPPPNRINYERKVAAARSRLNEDTFAAAWAEGRGMMLEEVIAEVIGTWDRDKRDIVRQMT